MWRRHCFIFLPSTPMSLWQPLDSFTIEKLRWVLMINVAIPSWSRKHPFDVTATNDKLVIYDKYTKLVTKFVQITSHLRFIIVIRNRYDVCWGTLGTSIFGNSSSVASNTRSRIPSRLSFRFLWLWLYQSLHILKHSEKIEMSFCVPFCFFS